VLRAARSGRKNSPSAHHRTTLSSCIFAIKARRPINNNLLNSNISSTCPHNMMNFDPLTAARLASFEHPSKFQQVSRLGFVTAPTSFSGGQPNFAQCLTISWADTLLYIYIYIHFWWLLPPNGILPGAKIIAI